MKISVIIPAYNVEKYLEDCISSVLNQTFQDFEIILVNDGSTDNTPIICDGYAAKDSRIKVIHKQNGGISSARNIGINSATGDYFMMIDSDDYLADNNVLNMLYEAITKNDCDVVMGKMVRSDGVENQADTIDSKYINTALDSYTFFKHIIRFAYTSVPTLYKRESVHCRFDDTIRYFEDGDFLFHLYTKDLKCSYIPEIVYIYRRHSGSLTTSVNPLTIDSFKRVAIHVREYADICYSKQMTNYYLQCYVMLYFWTLNKLCDKRYYKDRKKYIKQFNMEPFRKSVFKTMLSLKLIDKSIVYTAFPLSIATLLHPIVEIK